MRAVIFVFFFLCLISLVASDETGAKRDTAGSAAHPNLRPPKGLNPEAMEKRRKQKVELLDKQKGKGNKKPMKGKDNLFNRKKPQSGEMPNRPKTKNPKDARRMGNKKKGNWGDLKDPFRLSKGDKGKGDKGKGKGDKGGRRQPPNFFEPCQACFAFAAHLAEDFTSNEPHVSDNPIDETYCEPASQKYTLLLAPRGNGTPVIEGPGLPDPRQRLKDDEEMKAVTEDQQTMFVKHFNKVCSVVIRKMGADLPRKFVVPQKVQNSEDDMAMRKWEGETRRALCSKFCDRPSPRGQKTEL